MRKKFLFLVLFILFFLFLNQARAFCPVCVVTIGAGVGLCRYLRIDDLISGGWIGGLLMSMVILTVNWLNKRKIKFLFRKVLIFVFWYGISIFPLYFLGIIGHPANKFLGIDKLIFGIISGSIVFLISILFHNFLLKKNKGKSFFPFQKVVIPVSFLAILSLIFYFIC